MKKLNNNGLTLAELIVSFALVSVAMLYFYQTVSTVSKLYKKSKDETNLFSESTYTLRLLNSYCNKNRTDCNNTNKINEFLKKIKSELEAKSVNEFTINGKIYNKITLDYKDEDRVYTLYAKRADVAVSKVVIDNTEEINVACYDNEECDIVDQINNELQKSLNYIITVNDKKLVYYSKTDAKYTYDNIELTNKSVFNKNNVYNGTIHANSVISSYKYAIEYTGVYEAFLDNGGWKVKFLKSGTLNLLVPADKIKIDAFLVGGGGSGGDSPTKLSYYGANGGGGGYTETLRKIDLNKPITYQITIGAGGTTGDGQSTIAFNKEAKGGIKGANSGILNTKNCSGTACLAYAGSGGSGGGGGQYSCDSEILGGIGGINGQNGNDGNKNKNGRGYGRGIITCEFNEGSKTECNNGSYYSAGGNGGAGMNFYGNFGKAQTRGHGGAGGGADSVCKGVDTHGYNGGNAEPNTGSGGGGASATPAFVERTGGYGGSGIVIIRNARSR